jgi:streptogramin lyase
MHKNRITTLLLGLVIAIVAPLLTPTSASATTLYHWTEWENFRILDPEGLTQAPDGSFWWSLPAWDHIARFDPATEEFSDIDTAAQGIHGPRSLIVGPENHLWLNSDEGVVELDPATSELTAYPDSDEEMTILWDLVMTESGDLWVTGEEDQGIAEFDPATGDYTPHSAPELDRPLDLLEGPDGNLWFRNFGTKKLGRITPSGTITMFNTPMLQSANSLINGPDGAIWFADAEADRIGRITMNGTITTYADPAGHVDHPYSLVLAGDGHIWFGSPESNRIGRIDPTTKAIDTFVGQQDELAVAPIWFADGGTLWFIVGHRQVIDRMDLPTCDGRTATVVRAVGDPTTGGNDVVLGTSAAETIDGKGGSDTVCGGGGQDTLRGAVGNDRLLGGPGNDDLSGGQGADRLDGGANRDACDGGPQVDAARGCERIHNVPGRHT